MNHFKKFTKRLLRITLGFAFALSTMTFPSNRVLALDPVPGTITVDKTAVSLGGGLYEVTLSITGVPVVKSNDIVLVMDTSLSMSSAKMSAMKTAAKNFVDTIIGRNEGHRIAIIKFSDNPSLVLDFSQNATTLRSAIDGLTTTGYTHLEGGIYSARQLLNSASANPQNMKSIVVLGDGFPTRGYNFAPQYTGPINYEIRPNGTCRITVTDANRDNLSNYTGRFSFNYSQNVSTISTSSVLVEKSVVVNGTCTNGASDDVTITPEFSLADSVLWQGQQAQAAGATIYSVGLSVDATGQQILSSFANGGYYNGNSGNLSAIYAQIASQIIQAGSNAVLTDKMGSVFTFQNISSGYTMLDTNFNSTSEILTWNIGSIGSQAQVLKYIIKIDDGLPSGNYPANEYALLSYKDMNGLNSEKVFPQPIIELIVVDENDTPVATNDTYSVNEGNSLNVVNPHGVLSNDTDADGDSLSAVLVNDVTHGTLNFSADGTFTYTPDAHFNGADSFTYRANDGELDSNLATVSITVDSINDAPVALDDSYSTEEDTQLTVPALGVLSNDSDLDEDALSVDLAVDVQNGVLTLNSDGSFVYTPNSNFSGTDSFTYLATDGLLDSNVATVTITVGSENDVPKAIDDSYSIDEDEDLVVINPYGVLANDMDDDDDILNAILVSNVQHGTLVLNADGTFTYSPQTDFYGTDTFTYKANDGVSDSGVATVTITIESVNDSPVAIDDDYEIDEDEILVVINPNGVLSNDMDPEGDSLVASLIDDVQHGTLSLNADGTFTYSPNADFNGTDTFTYKASDAESSSNLVTVTIKVNPVNDPPIAITDTYETDEDTTLFIPVPGVLWNDYDIDSSGIHVYGWGWNSFEGSPAFNSDGSFSFTPYPNFNGVATITYYIMDSEGGTAHVDITIVVKPVNDIPLANSDEYSIDEDTSMTIPPIGVLENDSDADADVLTAILVAGPAHGELFFNADGSFTYLPDSNYHGVDSFTYKANDGNADSNTAIVTINIGSSSDAPIAVNDDYTVDEDGSLEITDPFGLLNNDSDADGDELDALLVSDVQHGTLELNADGTFTYVPNVNFYGTDTFTYQVNDGDQYSNVAEVTITVNPVNDAPVANNDQFTINEDESLNLTNPQSILSNDSDVDEDEIKAILVSDVQHGTLNLNSDGTFTYIPNSNFNGTDSFTYKANDEILDSNVATVTLTVVPQNDAPVAKDDYYSINEDNILNVPADGVLENDSDVDGPMLNVTLLVDVSHGTLTLNPDGSFVYTPETDFSGEDNFVYTLTDGSLTTNASVTITVNPVNDSPDAKDDTYATDEDNQLTISSPGVFGNDIDVDSSFTLNGFGQPSNGTVSIQSDGSFVYIPNANYHGADSFEYTITDGDHSDTATVVVTVNPINDVPSADDKQLTVVEGGTESGVFTGLDSDGDTLTFRLLTQPVNGTVTFNTVTGEFTYTHNGGESTNDSFTYVTNDGTSDSLVASISIIITPLNDLPTALGATYTILRGTTLNRAFVIGDADGDPLTITILDGPSFGSVTIGAGRFNYVHDGVALTSDSFTYRVTDGTALSPIRTIRINFTDLPDVNNAPVVEDAELDTDYQTVLDETVGDLGSDIDGDPLTFALVAQAAFGTVTLNADGTFRYVPRNGFEGTDSFTFKANDGKDDSNIATVTINVGEEIFVDPEPTPQAQLPWWWLLGLLPLLLLLIRRPRPEVQEVVLNPDGTITATWGYLGPRLMHKDYDRDESVLEVVSGDVKQVPSVDAIPYEFDRGRHENIFKTVSDKNAVVRWTIKKKTEELDPELVEKLLKKNQK